MVETYLPVFNGRGLSSAGLPSASPTRTGTRTIFVVLGSGTMGVARAADPQVMIEADVLYPPPHSRRSALRRENYRRPAKR